MLTQNQQQAVTQQFYSVDQTAEILGIHQLTVRRMIDRGELPAIRAGRAIRIPADALQNLPAA